MPPLARSARAGRFWLPAAVVTCAALFLHSGQSADPLTAFAAQGQAALADGGLEVLEVRSNIFMIAGAGGNITVQVGDDGVVVVDAGSAATAPAVIGAIRRISPQPVRAVIDTGPDPDHVGGNAVLAKSGDTFYPGTRRLGPPQAALRSFAAIIAAEKVELHMTGVPESLVAPGGFPTEAFHYSRKALFLNGEAIEVLHQPAAHTDSDVFAFFRRSDVLVAGDVYDTRRFPVIDVERGGSIDGELAALNRLTEIAVPSVPVVSREAGTVVIPGHGRLGDYFDVVEYRDMITIVRDRVRDLIAAGRTLDQVKAANPANGYVGRYGNSGGDWTTETFVDAVYRSLVKGKS